MFSRSSSHWYLAVICFAGHTKATYMGEITDDDESNAKVCSGGSRVFVVSVVVVVVVPFLLLLSLRGVRPAYAG